MRMICMLALLCAAVAMGNARAAELPPPVVAAEDDGDAGLAQRLGADERGMRQYVLVILKTGPTRVPDGPGRDAMFAGHFANIERLSRQESLHWPARSSAAKPAGGGCTSSRSATSTKRVPSPKAIRWWCRARWWPNTIPGTAARR